MSGTQVYVCVMSGDYVDFGIMSGNWVYVCVMSGKMVYFGTMRCNWYHSVGLFDSVNNWLSSYLAERTACCPGRC